MDVQDNDLRKEKEMVYKSERAVDSGNITTFIVKGKDTATFRIVSFKMSDNYAEINNIRRAERSIEISIFDPNSLEWKEIVPAGTFRYGDCIEMQMDDCGNILVKVRDFLRDYFGIEFSW
ncbi:MAG: hypothetical protein J6Q22_09790 [Prevotella sp.]|nr:hypothetical protein [Prevotella sp.]